MVEDWETSHLDGKCLGKVSYVYDRPVHFKVWLVSLANLSEGGVLLVNQDRMASFSRQDSNSIGQDGKCLTSKTKVFDILPIHCDKPGDYNQS